MNAQHNGNMIQWPAEFAGDDSSAWCDLPYEKRMEMLAFHAQMNLALIKTPSKQEIGNNRFNLW